jgi:N-acetylglucosamine kinase-like BadF-type ATPase
MEESRRSKIMPENKEQFNIARIVYDAYPHSDLLPVDTEQDCRDLQKLLARVTGENIGDGLFSFVVVEIVEGGDSTLAGAIRVLEQAKSDVEAVLQALRDARRNQPA